jgi:hypothetical protein
MSKMPVIDVEENITQIGTSMQDMQKEILRLEGMLRTFQGFKDSGLTIITLPAEMGRIYPDEKLSSIQEKPQ